ncbi:MAG: D-Ala-D-Ala carboxypeptidase family metallohydrolase [Paludibacteraceae bacterium]|nr:D-Ala-D-Ala carboxypeptidase family metallohydrolase [Paludibacteraceae bacterium]
MNKKLATSGIIAGFGLILLSEKKIMRQNYFSLSELKHSDTAIARGIDNTPTKEAWQNLLLLRDNVLNPVREIFGHPIRITSAYRCPQLEMIISGRAGNSQHMTGQAADMQPYSEGSVYDIFKAVIKNGIYDQLIIEQANGKKWVHVSYAPTLRKQILAYDGTRYTNITNDWQKYII